MDGYSKHRFPKRKDTNPSLNRSFYQGDILRSDTHDKESKISTSESALPQFQQQKYRTDFPSTNSSRKLHHESGDFEDGPHCRAYSSSSPSPPESPRPSKKYIAAKVQNNMVPLRLTKSSDSYDQASLNQTKPQRNYRSRFTHTQQMKEELYDCLGEKPCNLNEESIVLYQNLDCERRNLLARKVLCTFMYAAMKRQRQKIYNMERSNKIAEEAFAARIVQNALLRNLQRKTKERIVVLIGENQQLENSIHGACLQLRVTRHSQIADKEKVMEKQKELNQFKTDITYIKKMLVRTKQDLELVTKECETAQIVNEKLLEEKKKLQRETRSLQERKDMLQSSLDNERKRSEKQRNEIRGLNRQMSDLKIQISALNSQIQECQETCKELENRNLELQELLQAKGKEYAELGKKIDSYKIKLTQIKRDNVELNEENFTLEDHLRKSQCDVNRMETALVLANNTFEEKSVKIVETEKAIATIQEENTILKHELYDYKLKNIRKRRAWVAFTMTLSSPLECIAQLIFGINASSVNPLTAQSFKHLQEILSEPE